MELVSPDMQYEESWREAMNEFRKEKLVMFWNRDGEPEDLASYIAIQEERKRETRCAPASTYWLIDHMRFIGHINIRHVLTEAMQRRGGNVGYAIRPSERGKKYGIAMLGLALEKAKGLGLHRLLIICSHNNLPSRKVIESNGGVLQDVIDVDGDTVRRYWIQIP